MLEPLETFRSNSTCQKPRFAMWKFQVFCLFLFSGLRFSCCFNGRQGNYHPKNSKIINRQHSFFCKKNPSNVKCFFFLPPKVSIRSLHPNDFLPLLAGTSCGRSNSKQLATKMEPYRCSWANVPWQDANVLPFISTNSATWDFFSQNLRKWWPILALVTVPLMAAFG